MCRLVTYTDDSRLNASGCKVTTLLLSQTIRAKLVLRISFNWSVIFKRY